jgi:DNA-binding response OmpR family regulator
MRILIVEDQENMAKLIQRGLTSEGFAADYVLDGETAQNRINMNHADYDLIILDLMLPKKSGVEICADTRAQKIATPIIMLTARDSVEDIAAGLDSGADDYLPKPFSFEELLARIRAILRRPKASLPTKLTVQDISLDPARKQVARKGKEIRLTLKEFSLLEYLMRHPDEVATREQLLSGVWDFAFDSFANVVDVHLTNLRKKLGDHGGKIIETVRGVGYRLNSK